MAIVLGIETSCDDACAALVEDGRRVLAEVRASQEDDFAAWGGVVPELAARGHLAALPDIIERTLSEAGLALDAIDAVAVTAWPGLVGSLLVGVTAAKAVALARGLPLVAVDHVAAHLAAVHLGREAIGYPLAGLVASGGHSHLYACRGPGDLTCLGGTIDDAAGEAFDKAAAVLGLGYPGGPVIARAAEGGDPRSVALPRSFRGDGTPRLSFSGLKTAIMRHARGPDPRSPLRLDPRGVSDAAASFQAAVVDCLADKALLAARLAGARTLAVGGGVAGNRRLRERLAADAAAQGLELLLPEPRHCTDNAAMIAALGFFLWKNGEVAGLDLAPLPTGRVRPRPGR